MTNRDAQTVILVHGSGADHWAGIIHERCPDVEAITTNQHRTKNISLGNVGGLIGWRFPNDILEKMPDLRWIQSISVGVDAWIGNPLISANVVITNTKGLYSDSVANYVMWSILTMSRQFHVVLKNQRRRRWHQISGPSLRGKTLAILGLGGVGKAVARRAAAFEMHTIGVVSEEAELSHSACTDNTVPVSSLPDVIQDVDVLVICVPLTSATQGLISSSLISAMKPTAYLVNTSRAGIVDEKALVTALKNKQLAGAALDVFDQEPLRLWSPLWNTRNLLVTPHVAAITDDYQDRVGELICDNVNRFSSGDTLRNIVDPDKGY